MYIYNTHNSIHWLHMATCKISRELPLPISGKFQNFQAWFKSRMLFFCLESLASRNLEEDEFTIAITTCMVWHHLRLQRSWVNPFGKKHDMHGTVCWRLRVWGAQILSQISPQTVIFNPNPLWWSHLSHPNISINIYNTHPVSKHSQTTETVEKQIFLFQ